MSDAALTHGNIVNRPQVNNLSPSARQKSIIEPHTLATQKVGSGSWLCEDALPEVSKRRDLSQVAMWEHFFGLNYALIAARSGGMPMMFMTRMRL
jgi:hypothetical protein